MKSIRKSMWGMYWKLHDKRKRLAASLKGYLDGLPPETRRRIVLGGGKVVGMVSLGDLAQCRQFDMEASKALCEISDQVKHGYVE